MKQSELQTPISQLFNTPLKSLFFLLVNFFQIGCSEPSNKTHNFRSHFCDVITLDLYCWKIRNGALGKQNARLLHWPKYKCVGMKTKLWKFLLRLAVYIPSLIVQWPTRIFIFSCCA